jgi:hypothetical protein
MKLNPFTEIKETAHEKWREYRNAEKSTKDPIYTDLKKMYWQIKHGKVLIDISKVIAAGGIHSNHHPKLAVCRATCKKVRCEYWQDGKVRYMGEGISWRDMNGIVELHACLPKYTFKDDSRWRTISLSAPVPIIPPKCLPKKLTDDHFILWEVDVWEMVPPTDPYLLRRIAKNIYAVESQWDLTDLEKAAMKGRMI